LTLAPAAPAQEEDTLLDYEEEEQQAGGAVGAEADAKDPSKKGHYTGVHSSGFKDFMLRPEVLRSVVDWSMS
jgi:hypothetical protein